MALSMHTNYASLVTQNNITKTNDLLNTSMERLSTGLRINSAADDAAGLQIANRLEAQSRGMGVASRNAQDAISMMQTAEGGMDEMTNIAYRMNDLATQAANGSLTTADREAINTEYTELGAELQNIFDNSNFGGRSLFSGPDSFSSGAITFQIGSTASETLDMDVSSELSKVGNTLAQFGIMSDIGALKTQAEADYNAELDSFATKGASTLTDGAAFTPAAAFGSYTDYADLKAKADAGVGTAAADLTAVETAAETSVTKEIQVNSSGNYVAGSSGVNVGAGAGTGDTFATITSLTAGLTDQASATSAMGTMSTFIDDLGESRAQFGANINRLDHTITNLGNMTENLEASKGRIMDADFAVESSNMTKNQMLMQAGTSMLSRTNQMSGMAMSLLG
ncbi:flagellin [Vibrio sp. nBUS_14]|uniref:flagellin N-terminal helical domain-containing protein n=1 Tax=Vibrio sp. nBUS_14 TaxID=3395321 RepID=UPI003EBD32C3